ncbi:helix-turn-helix domain-containing protein [Oerskovia enterophila]|uniref:helix-turn-helix domain-containing protein n=1 Tax=Oerskovia enterophila TaxID=43678 RepID=UPI001471AED1
MRGRTSKLTSAQQRHVPALHTAGEHTSGDLAERFGVSRATIQRALVAVGRGRRSSRQREERPRTWKRSGTPGP